jgi:hypothetical protein
LYHETSKEVNPLQIWNMDSSDGMQLGPQIDSNESVFLHIRQKDSKFKFRLGRTWIYITMKFIN